jgi:hypothetical protein
MRDCCAVVIDAELGRMVMTNSLQSGTCTGRVRSRRWSWCRTTIRWNESWRLLLHAPLDIAYRRPDASQLGQEEACNLFV